jgi:hypothetical protein
MRDRQPIGNVIQQEVIEATCSSAQVPTVSVILNGNVPEPAGVLPATFYPAPAPNINTIQQAPLQAGNYTEYLFVLNNLFTIFLCFSFCTCTWLSTMCTIK